MKKKLFALLSVVLGALIFACPHAAREGPEGYLFIIGGGSRSETMMRKFVDLAASFGGGGIVIFTMASGVPHEVGPELVEEFRTLGATPVVYHQLTREEALEPGSVGILEGAGGVYFAGGVQSRLIDVLLDTPLHQNLLELHQRGCIIGGTSAGAAVMSEIMITGDERREVREGREWSTIEAANVITVRGFGLVKGAIVDQHFVARKRHNRLMSLVLEKPTQVGLGIDESTAVLVRPDGAYEVLGDNQVIVYDARKAEAFQTETGRLGGYGIAVHVLLPGDVFHFAEGTVEKR